MLCCIFDFFQNGESKGFAYVEFLHEEVAKIVAETMNNYLMYNCCLKCKRSHSIFSSMDVDCQLVAIAMGCP